jgi:hypothetical protein
MLTWSSQSSQTQSQQGTTSVASQATPSYHQWVIRTFRVVAHTLGPVIPGGVLSANHWTVYLLVGGGRSVQINMMTNLRPGETSGNYEVTQRTYEHSNTAVQYFDFPAKDGVTVGYVLDEITRRRWQRYNMTDGRVGCQ